jgi:dTDP-4-dehydrorhamnose reductase
MRILVTGATGLVASRLCRLLRASSEHTLITHSRQPGADVVCELVDSYECAMVFEKLRPDLVINPAGMTDVDACERAPRLAEAANVVVVRNLALAAQNYGARLLHVSTDYVFDGEAGPYSEDARPTPRGVYARTKYEGELEALARGFPVARTAVVYGWPPEGGRLNFGAWLVTKLRAGERVRLFSDQLISPTWAESAAQMLIEVGTKHATQKAVWHLSGAEVLDRVSFGRKLCDVFGLDASLIDAVPMAEVAMPTPRPKRAGLIIGRANALEHRPLGLDAALRAFHSEWSADAAR